MNQPFPHAEVEAVARASYGRLIAYLASRSGDVALAEDALGDALVAALSRWPSGGVPARPEAWLLAAARNRLVDLSRRCRTERRFEPAVRTPLMLQVILGVDANRIAQAFLVSPAAMGQRLVRAKMKIRDAGIPFRVPQAGEWRERVSFVLDAVYAAYTSSWDSVRELASEAVTLGRMLVALLPEEAEALGVLALMLHCEARRDARLTLRGTFVPLDEQDTNLWSRPMIEEAEARILAASALKQPGRYQIEAAIQSIHTHRCVSGRTDWPSIAALYRCLVQLTPAIGARVGQAVALAETGEPEAGLDLLDGIPPDRVVADPPYWAARGHVLRTLGRSCEARASLQRAAALVTDPAMRNHLLRRSEEA